MTLFWSQKRKKEIRASLCPLKPNAGEEEKEKKKKKKKDKKEKEVGEQGSPVDRIAPKRHLCEGALRRLEPRRAFHNYGW